MRKLKMLWRSAVSSSLREEIEAWASVLLALAAVLLLYATLKAQAAEAEERLRDVATRAFFESTVAAGARSIPCHEAYVHAVLAPGMPLKGAGSHRTSP